jgi:cytochrome c-type biogenesis protein CcmE
VLEGRFSGEHFASDRILVKHSETYEAEHPDRVTTSSVPLATPTPANR